MSTAWWVTTYPGVVLMGFVLGIGFIGTGSASAWIPECDCDGGSW